MPPSSTQQFSGIFVSYRRDDSSGHAGRLADGLVEHFGRNRIFVDIDTIEPGEDFVTVIENAVASCEILLAVIGQNWLSASGTGRLDNPNDFVRLEIATALRREIRVIPVLVQRASMPKPQDLPEDLIKLTRRNAVELSDLRWQSDVDQLITVMERVLTKQTDAQQLAEPNHSDEDQRRQEAKEKRRVEEPIVVAEKTKLHDHRRTVESEQEAEPFRADVEAKVRAEQEREPIEAVPATIVTGGVASPASKHRRLILIAGASLIVLFAATILIWLSQRDHNPSGNSNRSAAVPPVTQPTPAQPIQTPELKPSPSPNPVAFGEPTFWKRSDTGTTVEIVRNGNTVTAFMHNPSQTAAAAGRRKGDVAFKGSYEGGTIKGTAYIRFSEEDVIRCPAFGGEQQSDLKLTLSADGNTLSGSREDYKLSTDCVIMTIRRKKLTYTKTSP